MEIQKHRLPYARLGSRGSERGRRYHLCVGMMAIAQPAASRSAVASESHVAGMLGPASVGQAARDVFYASPRRGHGTSRSSNYRWRLQGRSTPCSDAETQTPEPMACTGVLVYPSTPVHPPSAAYDEPEDQAHLDQILSASLHFTQSIFLSARAAASQSHKLGGSLVLARRGGRRQDRKTATVSSPCLPPTSLVNAWSLPRTDGRRTLFPSPRRLQ